MARDRATGSELLAGMIEKYFAGDESNLLKIKTWAQGNSEGYPLIKDKDRISAIWLYKWLKQYNPETLDDNLLKDNLSKKLKLEAEEMVDYFSAQQDSEKIILLYDKYKQGYRSLKTNQEVNTHIRKLKKTVAQSIKKYLKIEVGDISDITDARLKQTISNKIREHRLHLLQGYLQDLGYNQPITASLTLDEIINDILPKSGVGSSRLKKYIILQVSERNSPVLNENESEGASYRTSVTSDNDRTEYNHFLRQIKQEAEIQLDKPLNKVLLDINNYSTQIQGLKIIKLYGIHNLNIDLDVNEETSLISKVSIKRSGGGHKQDNHIIPVSTFLKTLEKHLKGKALTKDVIKNLVHQYGKYLQESADPSPKQRNVDTISEFDWIKDKIEDFNSKNIAEKVQILEKYVIPFIYYNWNTRVEATFQSIKDAKAYGVEGNLIRNLNKKFNELNKLLKREEITSISDFKDKIKAILPEYWQAIDLPPANQLSSKRIATIINDARRLFKIWFSLLENIDTKLNLRNFLDSNGENEYKTFKQDFFDRKKFGEQLIESKQQLTRAQKQDLKRKLNEYIQSTPETVDSQSEYSELERSFDSEMDPPLQSENLDRTHVRYTVDQIKLLLKQDLPNKNIEHVYFIESSEQYHDAIDHLKKQLKKAIHSGGTFEEKTYVLIEQSDEKYRISSAISINLFNENGENQIKLLPIVGSSSGLIISELGKIKELSAIPITLDPLPKWIREHQDAKIYLSNIIEIIKLSIKCHSPCKIEATKIEEIINKSPLEYEEIHSESVNIEEQAGTSGILKRQLTRDSSPSKRVKFNLEDLEEQRNNIGLRAVGSSCSLRPSSSKRSKRELCQQEENVDLFPYEPLKEMIPESSRISARLYSQIACLVALKPSLTHSPFNPEDVFAYNTNIGDILSEGEVNHSVREKELLKTHYEEAKRFFERNPKDSILKLVEGKVDLSNRGWLFDNGKQSLLVSYHGTHYQVYSQDLNYRQRFKTKEGVSFADIELFAEAFFKWHSGNIEYNVFALSQDLPEECLNKINQANFWQPDKVVSDLVLLNKGSFSKIENIPAKTVRELFLLEGNVPELAVLQEGFFNKYTGKISIRVEALHNVLSSLTLQESEALVALVKKYDFPVDAAYLSEMPQSEKDLLNAYHEKVNSKLKTTPSITIQELSDLSWKILDEKMREHADISNEVRESSLKSMKELYGVASKHAHALGMTSQTLFFLPDIMRSINSGNFEGLAKSGGMMLGDMAANKMYGSLISKLESVLPAGRAALIKKLPITSPIFKIVTIYSIVELHKELNSLPPDSERVSIIKHQLGEQYFAVGLMVAELFGLELGPLWIGLMAEQLIYGAIALRKQYHLDISFGEAFLMNLGFEQDKLKSILAERQLVDFNLLLVDKLMQQTNTSYELVVVKIPRISYNEPKAENTLIEFTPDSNNFCMEDNAFLERVSDYRRISSVIVNQRNNNCNVGASFKISDQGLAALYRNNDRSASRAIYINFDPNEGEMKLHFTKAGINALNGMSNHQESGVNITGPYVVTTRIYYKPYPDQTRLLRNQNYKLTLNDESRDIASNHYIDGTSSFQLEDNSKTTAIGFLNNKLFHGYNAYVSGSTSHLKIKSIYSDAAMTGSVVLNGQDYLKLNLEYLLLNGTLVIDTANVEVLYVKGASSRSVAPAHFYSHRHLIEINPVVVTFKLLLEAPSIGGINIKNTNTSDVIIDTGSLNRKPVTLSLQGMHTTESSYYHFSVENLQPVLDEMAFMSRFFPEHFVFICSSSGSMKGWCKWSTYHPEKNILSFSGKLNERNGVLTVEHDKAKLEIVKRVNGANTGDKRVEVINYRPAVRLQSNLKFKDVLSRDNWNMSFYSNYIRKHNFKAWNIIEFTSNEQVGVLQHFNEDKVKINSIDYFVLAGRMYVALSDKMDGRQLLIDAKGTPVPIFVDAPFHASQISFFTENVIKINSAILFDLPAETTFLFKDKNNAMLSLSLKKLQESFQFNSEKEYSLSLQNQVKAIQIHQGKISIDSYGTNLDRLLLKSQAYGEIVNTAPYNIERAAHRINIKQYGQRASLHELVLIQADKQITVEFNSACDPFLENRCIASQYELSCFNIPMKIIDATGNVKIILNQHDYIGSNDPTVFSIICDNNRLLFTLSESQRNLELHNPLIRNQWVVNAEKVVVRHAVSVNGSEPNIIAKENTKYFNLELEGSFSVKKYHRPQGYSILKITAQQGGRDAQTTYQYTQTYNIPTYTLNLKNIIEQLFFKEMVVRLQPLKEHISFRPNYNVSYTWNSFSDEARTSNGTTGIVNIKGALSGDKKALFSMKNGKYTLNVRNGTSHLVLQEIKYHAQKEWYSIPSRHWIFKGILSDCHASYYCRNRFSPNSFFFSGDDYLTHNNILEFHSTQKGHNIFLHLNHQFSDGIHRINGVDYSVNGNVLCVHNPVTSSNSSLLPCKNDTRIPLCNESTLLRRSIRDTRERGKPESIEKQSPKPPTNGAHKPSFWMQDLVSNALSYVTRIFASTDRHLDRDVEEDDGFITVEEEKGEENITPSFLKKGTFGNVIDGIENTREYLSAMFTNPFLDGAKRSQAYHSERIEYPTDSKSYYNSSSSASIVAKVEHIEKQLMPLCYILLHTQIIPIITKHGPVGGMKYLVRKCNDKIKKSWNNRFKKTGMQPLGNYLQNVLTYQETLKKFTVEFKDRQKKIENIHEEKEKINLFNHYQNNIEDTEAELQQLIVRLQKKNTIAKDQIADIEILKNYITDLMKDSIEFITHKSFQVKMQEILTAHEYGVKVINVPSDGNCFFHAVAEILNDGSTAQDLREMACSYISSHPDKFKDSLTDEGGTIGSYVRKQKQDGQYVDHLCIQALSNRLGKDIIIMRDKGRPNLISASPFRTQNVDVKNAIVLWYVNQNHYMALKVIDQNTFKHFYESFSHTASQDKQGSKKRKPPPPDNDREFYSDFNVKSPSSLNWYHTIKGRNALHRREGSVREKNDKWQRHSSFEKRDRPRM